MSTLILPPEVGVSIGSLFILEAKCPKGSRPVDVEAIGLGAHKIAANFAELRFDQASGQLLPHCELVNWHDLTIVVGLPAVMVATPDDIRFVPLYRSIDEDTGFYEMKCFDDGKRLLAVYESGILALSEEGCVLWHRKKHWDDQLIAAYSNSLEFVDSDARTFAVNSDDGSLRE